MICWVSFIEYKRRNLITHLSNRSYDESRCFFFVHSLVGAAVNINNDLLLINNMELLGGKQQLNWFYS